MLIYIVDTLKVLTNVFLYFVIVVALIVLAWTILWKLILNQVSFIREIVGLPKLNTNKPLQHHQTSQNQKKRRQSSTSSSTTHSRRQSISSSIAHSRHQSTSSPSHNRQQSIQQHNNVNSDNSDNSLIHQRTFSSSSTNQYQGGESVPMGRRISSTTNKIYQSQDDTAHKNYNHTKSDSKISVKSVSSNKILPIENDEDLNFEEDYIS
ncbi:hypothetical protein C1645_783865 [Glomus cerebriforme]|uniref:Uncharacterized protein n=1 Tax=Glomus cerebriforme TaxID=658196 RepID=A0A397SI16_9GLOM|nr:hypothetical protein C1645_783865 [Glomus cerebriforme]